MSHFLTLKEKSTQTSKQNQNFQLFSSSFVLLHFTLSITQNPCHTHITHIWAHNDMLLVVWWTVGEVIQSVLSHLSLQTWRADGKWTCTGRQGLYVYDRDLLPYGIQCVMECNSQSHSPTKLYVPVHRVERRAVLYSLLLPPLSHIPSILHTIYIFYSLYHICMHIIQGVGRMVGCLWHAPYAHSLFLSFPYLSFSFRN